MARAGVGKGRRRGKTVKRRIARADNPPDVVLGGVELNELRRLIRLVRRSGIGELELSSGGRTVRISAQAAQLVAAAGPGTPAGAGGAGPGAGVSPAPAEPRQTAEKSPELAAILSPMVGTFYRAPAPDADPYVEVGDIVEVGQTVCIVEAMKLMNEIESEMRGRVVQVVAENAQPVEFGQKLFLVEPVLSRNP